MEKSTITTKGQVTIPASIRETLSIHAGDEIYFVVDFDQSVRIIPKEAKSLKGILKSKNKLNHVPTDEEMNAAIAEALAEKYAPKNKKRK